MKRPELLARTLVIVAVVVAVGTPLWIWSRTPLINAHMAENGGWTPDVLQAKAGEPLHLHLTSDDVMHGFAVGQTDMQSVDVEPGKVTDVTLNFDKPGTYTFYCTRWCGINHWRMRGTIEVSGPDSAAQVAAPPLYVTLGLDLDAPHDAPVIPGAPPSATDGQQLAPNLSISEFTNTDFYRAHSPYETWKALRAKASLSSLDDQQIWHLVAFIWQVNTSAEGIAEGKKLYAQNCAACHGETGGGNGVFAADLAAAGEAANQTMSGASTMTMQRPADFTDPKRMLGASPALLQGKILRGGMGTGMPTWGVIFNEDQIWKIVGYLYSFQFQEAR
jgi:mono/diheme cytochrome c family protein/plastocyanin